MQSQTTAKRARTLTRTAARAMMVSGVRGMVRCWLSLVTRLVAALKC